MPGVRCRVGTGGSAVTRPTLRVLPGGHHGETLVLGGREHRGMGVSLVLELLERGRERGQDRDASLVAAAGVVAMRCAQAVIVGDPLATAYAALAVALHEEAITVGVQAAWDAACAEPDGEL